MEKRKELRSGSGDALFLFLNLQNALRMAATKKKWRKNPFWMTKLQQKNKKKEK